MIVDLWPAVPESIHLTDEYWSHDEHTYHESNMDLKKAGFEPVVCLVTLRQRRSLLRDGLHYEFFPIDDPAKDYREQTSTSLMEAIHNLNPDVLIVHLPNRRITDCIITDPDLHAIKVLQINTYHTFGTTFEQVEKNPGLVDAYFVNSSSLKETIQARHSIAAEKILVLPSAVDLGLYSPDLNATKRWSLIWTGQMRMDDDKRLEILISLIEKTGLNLLLVGDGPKRVFLERLAATAGVETRVEFRGWIPYYELPALLNQASIYVTTASMDPSSRSLTEALSCGLPVLGFENCPGLEEQVTCHYNGFLVKDLDQMAEAAKSLLADRELYTRLSRNSRIIAEQRFGRDQRTTRLAHKLLELLEGANGKKHVKNEI